MASSPATDPYAGRRVLITGGSGFLGLNLVAALRGKAAELRTLSRGPLPDPDGVDGGTEGVRHFLGDLRDRALVEAATDGCDVIFNLAAHSGPASSNQEPFEDLDTNLNAQLTLLEVCRTLDPTPTIVFASSRLVYRPTDRLPVAETALTGPLSIYGVHKLAAEHYHLLYGALYGLKTVVLRITNPYGRYQRLGENRYGIINWFIHRAVNGQTLPIYGDGHQIRDYVSAEDVVRALLLSATEPNALGQILNVGSGQGLSIREAAAAIVEAAGLGTIECVPWPKDAASVETGDFVADIGRIGSVLGWRPSIAPQAGLQRVVREYRQMEQLRAGSAIGEGGRA
jgi:nucleoside-diphosphate-sugar epimerase